MKFIFSLWILLVITFSCVLGIVYLVVQQEMRMNANDPQLQIAEDIANNLDVGHQIAFSQKGIDISKSLSPFVMTFDLQGKLQSSEATLDGIAPTLPDGVFAYTKEHGENRLTWQPKLGVRIAAVIAPYNNGFVVVGRNLREVEKREDNLLWQIIIGWSITLVISFLAAILFIRRK